MILWKLLVLLNVLKNFLILILIKSSLDSWIFESWILILIILKSWILKSNFLLILEVFLTQSWTHSWMSSSLLSWSDLDFWAFCHHLCYHQNSLNQSWFIMKLASIHPTNIANNLSRFRHPQTQMRTNKITIRKYMAKYKFACHKYNLSEFTLCWSYHSPIIIVSIHACILVILSIKNHHNSRTCISQQTL